MRSTWTIGRRISLGFSAIILVLLFLGGFAVVADEVRDLAQRSGVATHKTNEKIGDAQESARYRVKQQSFWQTLRDRLQSLTS